MPVVPLPTLIIGQNVLTAFGLPSIFNRYEMRDPKKDTEACPIAMDNDVPETYRTDYAVMTPFRGERDAPERVALDEPEWQRIGIRACDVYTTLGVEEEVQDYPRSPEAEAQLQQYVEKFPRLFEEANARTFHPAANVPEVRLEVANLPHSSHKIPKNFGVTTMEEADHLLRLHRDLEQQGIIEQCPDQEIRMFHPTFLVRKKDGDYRIVVDFREFNKVLSPVHYPIPRMELILDAMSRCPYKSKIDLRSAYFSVPLEANSRAFLGVKIGKLTFRYRRLPMGIAVAPAVFARCVESLLQGLGFRV